MDILRDSEHVSSYLKVTSYHAHQVYIPETNEVVIIKLNVPQTAN